ncbi:putative lipid kinase [Dirofilaria immitis]
MFLNNLTDKNGLKLEHKDNMTTVFLIFHYNAFVAVINYNLYVDQLELMLAVIPGATYVESKICVNIHIVFLSFVARMYIGHKKADTYSTLSFNLFTGTLQVE